MKTKWVRGIRAVAVLALGGVLIGQTAGANERELVWSDEFDGDSLDRSKWNVEVNDYGGWNDELQYYCDSQDNIIVSDGTLKIRALKKNYGDRALTLMMTRFRQRWKSIMCACINRLDRNGMYIGGAALE